MRKGIKIIALLFVHVYHLIGQDHELICHIQNPKGVPRERVTDFKSAKISLDINPYKKQVQGFVEFQFEVIRPSVDSFWLDAPNMRINCVMLDHDSIEFETNEKGVFVFPDSTLVWGNKHQLRVNYTTNPKKGMYFVGWDSCFTNTTPNQVWTQGQGIDNRHWFPHFDDLSDKLTTETIIRFQNGFEVLSNGELVNKNSGDSATVWHYQMKSPHSSYLTMVAIGDYGVDTLYSESGVRIKNWYYKNRPEKVTPTYHKTAELMDFLESYTGVPYPWGDYAQVPVHNFLYGAMENTSATIFSDDFFVDSTEFFGRNYVYVNAHEMAHQWFGNLITSRSPEAHWIHEGFATYFHGSWQGEVFGQEAGDLMFDSFKKQAILAGELNQLPITHAEAGSSRHYMKSACVLRMLHDEVGEEVFKKTLTYFLNRYAHHNVTSEDFMMAFQDVAGLSLNWFFEDWVYKGGEPVFNFTVLSNWQNLKGTFLKIEQLNTSEIDNKRFHLPVDVVYKEGIKHISPFISGDTVLELSAQKPSKLDAVIIDPYKHVLMKASYNNWSSSWMKFIVNDSLSNVITKKEAIEWLANQDELSQKQLTQFVYSEKSDYLRATYLKYIEDFKLTQEILNWLDQNGAPLSKQVIIPSLTKQDELAVNALNLLANDKNNDVVSALMVKLGNEEWITPFLLEELDARTAQYPKLRLNFAQLLFVSGEFKRALSELETLTGPSNSIDVRISAFSLLAQLEYESPELAMNYYEAITSFNRKLRNHSKKILKKYKENHVVEWVNFLKNQGCKSVFEEEIKKIFKPEG